MASFSITNITYYSVTIVLNGLSYGDEVRVFIRLADDPDDVTYDVESPFAGSEMMKFPDLEPETEYAINVNVNGTWLGTQSFTTAAVATPRPDDWEWWSTIRSGRQIEITADEWNAFCDHINAFRVYQGLSEYDFTTVDPGDEIKATYMRQARSAIDFLDGHGTLPGVVYAGDAVKASFFTKLADALNAVE